MKTCQRGGRKKEKKGWCSRGSKNMYERKAGKDWMRRTTQKKEGKSEGIWGKNEGLKGMEEEIKRWKEGM